MYADDLLSKWGFEDGDRLSDFMYDNKSEFEDKVNGHELLEELVKRYLLPLLKDKVEIYFIQTIHNPVRAEMINGRYYRNHYEHDDDGLLGDVSVELTLDEIEAVAKEMSRQTN
jgi:hypothetical protein